MASDQTETSSALYTPNSFRLYHPQLLHSLDTPQTPHRLKLSERKFTNLMPLLISDEVPHAVMMWLLNGDNWEEAILDMFKVHALTQDNDAAGPNVEQLGVFALFADWRQDQRTRKPLPEKSNEMAIVKSQASFSKAVARLMRYVAEVDYLVNLDAHSFMAVNHFLQEGIDTINLTAAFLIAEEIKNKGLIKNDMETMVCGIDMGNLSLVKALGEYLDLPIAIIRKWREAIRRGIQSKTHHELVFGDVRGKRVILVDDMISSGGTVLKTVELLLKLGAKEIIVCATHAVLSGNNYYDNLQDILALEQVKLVMTTSSIPLVRPSGEEKDRPYIIKNGDEKKELEILDLNGFIGWALQALLVSKNLDQAKGILEPHTLQLKDPYEVYEEITGKKMESPKDVAVYREGGHFEPLPGI